MSKLNLATYFAVATVSCFNLPGSCQTSAVGTSSSGVNQKRQGLPAPVTGASFGQMRPGTPNIWGAPPKNNRDQNIQIIKESPELANLPAYSGKCKLTSGYIQTTDKGWTTYQLVYAVKEPEQDVRDWYQNAFNSYQWKTTVAGRQTLSATDTNGHRCTVTVNQTVEPGYKTRLTVYYNQPPSN